MKFKLKFVSLFRESENKFGLTFNVYNEVIKDTGEVEEQLLGNLHLSLNLTQKEFFNFDKNYEILISEI